MFEDSLVESRVGQVTSSKRWTMLASIGLQVAVEGVVMVLPLLHPEGMPFRLVVPNVAMAPFPEAPVPVVVEAVISRKGAIESLRVVSGPQMLQNAALDAIREARYRPFRLNGEPTEVQTTITVNFRMGG